MTTPGEDNVRFTAANVEVNNVGDVVVTEAQQDPDTGDWIREIRIFGEEESVGAVRPHLLTIRVKGETEAAIKMDAPAQVF
jgi:hypothetical protein